MRNKKVEELVEWVAEGIHKCCRDWNTDLKPWNEITDDKAKTYWRTNAKHILSSPDCPDLALIDRDNTLFEEGPYSVILVAEALREVKDA